MCMHFNAVLDNHFNNIQLGITEFEIIYTDELKFKKV